MQAQEATTKHKHTHAHNRERELTLRATQSRVWGKQWAQFINKCKPILTHTHTHTVASATPALSWCYNIRTLASSSHCPPSPPNTLCSALSQCDKSFQAQQLQSKGWRRQRRGVGCAAAKTKLRMQPRKRAATEDWRGSLSQLQQQEMQKLHTHTHT